MTTQDLIDQIQSAKTYLNQAQSLINEVSGYVSDETIGDAAEKADELESSLDSIIHSIEAQDEKETL